MVIGKCTRRVIDREGGWFGLESCGYCGDPGVVLVRGRVTK